MNRIHAEPRRGLPTACSDCGLPYQELLEQVPLRDGLQYGDPELLKPGAVKPNPTVEVW